jgi:hypothetical protein
LIIVSTVSVPRTFWSKEMAGGPSDAQFGASVLGSPEAFTHVGGTAKELVDALYQKLLDRSADQITLNGSPCWQ